MAAALLHDVQEDCGIENATIAARFGDEVAHLVDGLTKLEKLPIRIGEGGQPAMGTMQAQNLRKMFLAMAGAMSSAGHGAKVRPEAIFRV